MMNEILVKALVFDKLIAHLEAHKNDPRKRERIRLQIALSLVNFWLKESEQEIKNENINNI